MSKTIAVSVLMMLAWAAVAEEWIKPAISQVGRKIVVDADLALELAHENTERITYKK